MISNLAIFLGAGILLWLMFRNEWRNIRLARTVKFQCIRCGQSCKHRVSLSKLEVSEIERQGYTQDQFLEKKWGFLLLKQQANKTCCFLDWNTEAGRLDRIPACRIYAVRPRVCKNFPEVFYGGIKGYDHRCQGLKR